LAIFFAIFMRNLNDDEEITQHIDDTNYLNLIHDKQRIHSNQVRLVALLDLILFNCLYRINQKLVIALGLELIV